MAAPRALTAGDAARLAEAFRLLQAGRVAEAAAIAEQVLALAPRSADALHMRALCSKAGGDLQGALQAFEDALALAPNDARLIGNYASFLCRNGRLEQGLALHRRALALMPQHGQGWMNLGLALIDAGDAASACEALDRAVALRPGSAAAWQGLGASRRAARDLEGAELALRRAVELAPDSGGAWLSLGVVRRLLGDPADALACHAQARRAGFSGPELEDAEASAHLDLGDARRALKGARRLTRETPGYAPGHQMLAQILWEHGASLAPGEEPRTAFRAAVAAQPDNRALLQACVRFLIEADAAGEALELLEATSRSADDPALVATRAYALAAAGRPGEASRLYAEAYPAMQADAGFLNLYAFHLLKAGDPESAAARAEEALQKMASHQSALACLGLAWRLLGDPREEWLCGYDRLVAEVPVETPPGYADLGAFLLALEQVLSAMHTAGREPVNQSLRGGSQTSGALFGRRDPEIVALRDSLAAAVQRYLAGLPDDPSHPFLGRRAAGTRFVGSWSVRLRSAGRHVNHIHQEGWISSAFYVSLPPSMAQAGDDDKAGCIQFGEPPAELGLDLSPRRIIRPQPGKLALFPSYLWHGTVPFTDEAPRLTVAFDAVPTG